MKKLMGYLVAFSGVALALLISLMLPIRAKAATTYNVNWDNGQNNWFVSDDGGKNWYSLDFIGTHFQAGDVIVADAKGANAKMCILYLPARAGEIAACGGSVLNINAPGVDKAYAVIGSTIILNCDVSTLVANAGAVTQVNGNVSNCQCSYDLTNPIKIGITGTVGSANARFMDNIYQDVMVYNVAAGKFSIGDNHAFTTGKEFYSLTPTGNTTTGNTTAANGNQLDSVPKTGDMRYAIIFFSLAAIATFAGFAVLGKKRVNVK